MESLDIVVAALLSTVVLSEDTVPPVMNDAVRYLNIFFPLFTRAVLNCYEKGLSQIRYAFSFTFVDRFEKHRLSKKIEQAGMIGKTLVLRGRRIYLCLFEG